ncbi:unnamed protein product [Porites lobata]|uniref:Phospholipase A2-like domain-containing protein n=1 Tax=Porites lobata TaxID=104759 RepID=A0ABN8QBE9_9CNID|nr:unnamed protein product [Porites lobata]
MYSYSDINDYIHQYMDQKSHHTTDSKGTKKYSINLTFVLSTYRVLVSLDGDYQLDLRGTEFGDLIGFEKKFINKTEYGSKLPNITNSIDGLSVGSPYYITIIIKMTRQSEYKKRFDPELCSFTKQHIYGEGITDVFKSRGKSKLASAILNQSPLTLRLKHSHLRGNDELMLTKRQIAKINKSIANGTGSDIKISKTQIRKSVKHGGNLFSSLASLGAKVLPLAIKGISKAVPALATGAATALGEIGLNKIFGKGGHYGIPITPEFFPMLPPIVREFTKSQINQINKAYQSGSGVVIKPTRKQIEGGFLGTLASIGIPLAVSLVSKMLGGGLQVDRHGGGYPYRSPPFIGTWSNPIGMGPSGYQQDKRGRTQFFCRCAVCGNKKVKYIKMGGVPPPITPLQTGIDGFVHYGLPWMGKKAVEMGRYGASELMRNKNLQKKAVNYGINKLTPFIQDSYKTDRPELDRRIGKGIDVHKQIGKLPKPKGGWTLPGHKYTGPYNDLENQVRYDPETGEILEIYDQPTGPTDAVAMQHDVDYSVCGDNRKCKNKADRKMVKSLDAIPWKERQWGHTLARTIINTKQKLGLGLNASRR